MGKHLHAAPFSESVKALAAQLQQLVALGVAKLLTAHQALGASLVAGDAVEGEPCPPSASPVRCSSRSGSRPPPGSGGLRPARGLDHVAHAHALGDVVPQTLVSGGGGRGHGVMLAAVGRPGQVWCWAAR